MALGPLGSSRQVPEAREAATLDAAETAHQLQMRLTRFLFPGTILTCKIMGEMFTSRVQGAHSDLA